MTRRAVFLTIAGGVGLLLTPWAIAWACMCPSWVSEERYYSVSSITQIDGTGDHVDAELLRWRGKTRMTVESTPDAAAVELWLRVHVEDGPVRNVRIDAAIPEAVDTGDPGETGARGGER